MRKKERKREREERERRSGEKIKRDFFLSIVFCSKFFLHLFSFLLSLSFQSNDGKKKERKKERKKEKKREKKKEKKREKKKEKNKERDVFVSMINCIPSCCK